MNRDGYKYRAMCLALLDRVGAKGRSLQTSTIAHIIGKSQSQTRLYLLDLLNRGFIVRHSDKRWNITMVLDKSLYPEFEAVLNDGHANLETMIFTLQQRAEVVKWTL